MTSECKGGGKFVGKWHVSVRNTASCPVCRSPQLGVMLANFVNGADVGMVQGGGSTSLPAKAFERLWVFGYILRQELQSDKATEFGVLGLVHHTHPAAPELLDDAVVRNGLADQFEGNSNPREAILGWMNRQVNASTVL